MLECVSQPHHQQWLTCHTAHYTSNQTLNLAVMQTYKQGTGDSSMFISNIRFLTEASPSVGPSLSALDSSSIDSAQYAAQHRPRSPGHQRCAVWRCGCGRGDRCDPGTGHLPALHLAQPGLMLRGSWPKQNQTLSHSARPAPATPGARPWWGVRGRRFKCVLWQVKHFHWTMGGGHSLQQGAPGLQKWPLMF